MANVTTNLLPSIEERSNTMGKNNATGTVSGRNSNQVKPIAKCINCKYWYRTEQFAFLQRCNNINSFMYGQIIPFINAKNTSCDYFEYT